jgi:cell division FtsZ-interacting protein ZapD
MEYWTLTPPEDEDTKAEGWWQRLSLLHFAVLRTTNLARISGGINEDTVDRALWQAALEGAKGTQILKGIAHA